MHFHFSLFQHGKLGTATLDDVVAALGEQLRDLGHTLSRYDGTDRGLCPADAGINILFEGFGPNSSRSVVANLDAGARIVVIVTEAPTGDTWNDVREGNPAVNPKAIPLMRDRMDEFQKIAHRFEALWCLVPGAAAKLRHLNPNAIDLELGHSPHREAQMRAIVKAHPEIADRPEFDFGFFGGKTAHRAVMIDRMRSMGSSVHTLSEGDADLRALTTDYGDRSRRDAEMLRCKVMLNPLAMANGKIVSSSRNVTALHLFRPVICEDPGTPSIWKQIVRFASPETFTLNARLMVKRWREEHAEQTERFRRLLPPEATVGRAIAETSLQRRAAA